MRKALGPGSAKSAKELLLCIGWALSLAGRRNSSLDVKLPEEVPLGPYSHI